MTSARGPKTARTNSDHPCSEDQLGARQRSRCPQCSREVLDAISYTGYDVSANGASACLHILLITSLLVYWPNGNSLESWNDITTTLESMASLAAEAVCVYAVWLAVRLSLLCFMSFHTYQLIILLITIITLIIHQSFALPIQVYKLTCSTYYSHGRLLTPPTGVTSRTTWLFFCLRRLLGTGGTKRLGCSGVRLSVSPFIHLFCLLNAWEYCNETGHS